MRAVISESTRLLQEARSISGVRMHLQTTASGSAGSAGLLETWGACPAEVQLRRRVSGKRDRKLDSARVTFWER